MGHHIGRKSHCCNKQYVTTFRKQHRQSFGSNRSNRNIKKAISEGFARSFYNIRAHMLLQVASKVQTVQQGKQLLLQNIENGKGLLKFKRTFNTARRKC